MTDDSDYLNRIAGANESVATVTKQKLQSEMVNSQVSLERVLRQGALNTAVSLAGVHKYEDRKAIFDAAEEFLLWLREGKRPCE